MITPTAAPAPLTRQGLRVSDVERDAVADRLSVHAAAGRLSLEEHEQRVAAAHVAVLNGDLSALEADLPDLTPQLRREARSPGWPALPLMLLVLTVLASVLVGHPVVMPLLAFFVWRQLRRSGRHVPADFKTW